MRFARVLQTHDQCDVELAARVEAAELDVLQLDYLWPHEPPTAGNYAESFLEQMRTLHKSLFLDPNLHLATNAGAGNVVGCAEALAESLCDHGDAELPLSVIRGDNLLPSLEQLRADGVELRDQQTGQLVSELQQPPVAARVELGAGPFATAWQEGARIIVAGNYDYASPVLAAAVPVFGWSWENFDALAQVTVAARMFDSVWQLSPQAEPRLQDDWTKQGRHEVIGNDVMDSLRQLAADGWLPGADVECNVSQALLDVQPYNLQLSGVHGRAGTQDWQLKLACLSGYDAEAKLRLLAPSEELASTVEKISQRITRILGEETKFRIEPMRFTEEHGAIVLRLHHEKQEKCLEFLNAVNQLCYKAVLPNLEQAQLPTCQPNFSILSCPIPREAVAVSVDTRPAKEWT